MPFDIIDLIEKNETLATCQLFNAEVWLLPLGRLLRGRVCNIIAKPPPQPSHRQLPDIKQLRHAKDRMQHLTQGYAGKNLVFFTGISKNLQLYCHKVRLRIV